MKQSVFSNTHMPHSAAVLSVSVVHGAALERHGRFGDIAENDARDIDQEISAMLVAEQVKQVRRHLQ
jgi:hypothetical protein